MSRLTRTETRTVEVVEVRCDACDAAIAEADAADVDFPVGAVPRFMPVRGGNTLDLILVNGYPFRPHAFRAAAGELTIDALQRIELCHGCAGDVGALLQSRADNCRGGVTV